MDEESDASTEEEVTGAGKMWVRDSETMYEVVPVRGCRIETGS